MIQNPPIARDNIHWFLVELGISDKVEVFLVGKSIWIALATIGEFREFGNLEEMESINVIGTDRSIQFLRDRNGFGLFSRSICKMGLGQ